MAGDSHQFRSLPLRLDWRAEKSIIGMTNRVLIYRAKPKHGKVNWKEIKITLALNLCM